MKLAHPQMLSLLALLPLLLLLAAVAARRQRKALVRFGNPALLFRAGASVSRRWRALKFLLLLGAASLLIIALAGPQWGATREKIERRGVDVVVALDTSLSMLAQDVAPSRMSKAKAAVENLLQMMKGDRIGIVVFAATAFTLCPLTLDYNAARMFMDIIDTRIVPDPGTNVSAALREAGKNFDPQGTKYKVLILISDGEHLELGAEDPVEVAEDLSKEGIVIFTVGVGDTKGSSIPLETDKGVVDKIDRAGKVVITKLDETTLRKIALSAKGKYCRLDNRASGRELAEIYAEISAMDKKLFAEEYQIHYQDRFQWFVAGAILCLALELILPERRRRRT